MAGRSRNPRPKAASANRNPSWYSRHRLILQMHGERPRGQSSHYLQRILAQGKVVAHIDTGADVFAAEAFEQGQSFGHTLVLVVLDGQPKVMACSDGLGELERE